MQKTADCGNPLVSVNMLLRSRRPRDRHRLAKMLRIMRLTVLFLIVAFMHTYAAGTAQNVTLTGRNLSLKQVFSAIRNQTGYVVFANERIISGTKPVSVSATDMPLEDLLEIVFKGQPLDYSIKGKTIFLSRKPVTTPSLPLGNEIFLAPPVKLRVVDSTGRPLSGASVTSRNGQVSGATDSDGFFNANVKEGEVLVVSYIGFETRRVTVTAAMLTLNDVVIRLVPAEERLEDIQVSVNTGYQRIRPEHSTGAVSRISTKEYESRISTNFLDGLVNRLPGLMINNDVNFTANGTSRSLFNIRGISTMSANQSPLIVIDGYPTELTLDMIDPNEIESVTILKDAAAATVYGVRASNGVVVIARKQAAQGKTRFTFRTTLGITPKEDYSRFRWDDNAASIVANYQRTLSSSSINASSWGQLATSTGGAVQRNMVYYLLAQSAANMVTPDQAAKSFAELENYDNLEDYSRLFLRSAVTQTYNFNLSGGSANATYYITGNYTGNRSSQIKNDNNRFLLSARSNLKLSRKLFLELTTDYLERRVNSAPVPGVASISPYERFQDVNGNPNFIIGSGISPWYNNVLISQGLYDQLYYPLVDVNEVSDKTRTVNNRFNANFNYAIGGGFNLSFGGIYETSRSDMDYFASELSSVARRYTNSYVVVNTDGTMKYNIPRGGYLRQIAGNTSGYTARAQLNYDKRFNEHSFNGILGGEIRRLVDKSNRASYFGYNNETLLHQPVDYAAITTGSVRGTFNLGSPFQNGFATLFDQQYVEDRFLSGYSNLVYSFRNTYSLTGSARIDQSNLFGTNPKYKYKPLWSLGAAWNIHNEAFLKEVNWLTQLKLRVAYGFNGNVAKMSLPQVIAQSTLNNYTVPASPALRLSSYANSSLRWEQTKSFNVGADYGIHKNISGSIDYYRKNSTDLLGNALIDPTIGVSPSLINRAVIQNNGIEFALRADWIKTQKLHWNMGLVMARNTSKVMDVYQRGDYNPQTLNSIGFVKDYPVGALFAYRYAGIDSAGYSLIMNGKGTLYHTNNNSLGSPTTALMASDTSDVSRYMGSSIPTINAGLSNTVDIGRFYVFCMINYYGGFKTRIPRPNPSAPRPLEGAGDYWKTKGDELTTDVMGLAAYRSANSNNAYNYADKYVVNADYITLADLTVSYRIDHVGFIKKAGFSLFELKAQASNLWTVGLNKYNYSMATGSFQKTYLTPTYTFAIFTNF